MGFVEIKIEAAISAIGEDMFKLTQHAGYLQAQDLQRQHITREGMAGEK